MCLSNKHLSLNRLCSNIISAATDISSVFDSEDNSNQPDRFVKLNSINHEDHILNVDGSFIGSPRAGYGCVLRNSAGLFISGLSSFILTSTDILLAELTIIHQDLNLAIELNVTDLMCYSDSLIVVHFIKNDTPRFHIYVVLIQNIKDLLVDRNISLHHTLREGNQCLDYFAKLGASSDSHMLVHHSPLADLIPLLRADAIGACFLRS